MLDTLETLDERLLRIHKMWVSPPWSLQKDRDGTRAVATSCFKAPPLPLYQRWRFRDEYQLPPEDIEWWFIVEKNIHDDALFSWCFFDMVYERCFGVRIFPLLASKIIVQHLSSKFPDRGSLVNLLCEIDLEDFSAFMMECGQYGYSWKYIQQILDRFIETKTPLTQLTLDVPYAVVDNVSELEAICDKVIAENQKSVEDYRKGKLGSINHLKGQVMKATKGKADPSIVNKILESRLK